VLLVIFPASVLLPSVVIGLTVLDFASLEVAVGDTPLITVSITDHAA
jgi:hypothetical protein